jgi:hypothetical protein
MKYHDNQFSIEEVEKLCLLYQDCQLPILEEMELEYVLSHYEFNSPMINDTKELMAISRSVKFVETKKLRKPIWAWIMRVAACVAIILGSFAIFRYNSHVDTGCDECIVYVSGERANSDVAHKIAEADVTKIQQFMHVVSKQKAIEELKVEKFMNHINQSK